MTVITSTDKPATATRDLVCARQSASAAATVVVAMIETGTSFHGPTWIESRDASGRLRNSSRSSLQHADNAPAAFRHDDTWKSPRPRQARATRRIFRSWLAWSLL